MVGWKAREKAKGKVVRARLGAAVFCKRLDADHGLATWAVSRRAENMVADTESSERKTALVKPTLWQWALARVSGRQRKARCALP